MLYWLPEPSYTIWQFKEFTSHSLFVLPHGVLFSINICSLTYKDLQFTSFQLMLSMFSATFSSVKHATFVYIAKELSNLLTYFLSHPGTVNHIWVHIPKSAACQCDTKGVELRQRWQEYNLLTRHRRKRMRCRLMAYWWHILNFF